MIFLCVLTPATTAGASWLDFLRSFAKNKTACGGQIAGAC